MPTLIGHKDIRFIRQTEVGPAGWPAWLGNTSHDRGSGGQSSTPPGRAGNRRRIFFSFYGWMAANRFLTVAAGAAVAAINEAVPAKMVQQAGARCRLKPAPQSACVPTARKSIRRSRRITRGPELHLLTVGGPPAPVILARPLVLSGSMLRPGDCSSWDGSNVRHLRPHADAESFRLKRFEETAVHYRYSGSVNNAAPASSKHVRIGGQAESVYVEPRVDRTLVGGEIRVGDAVGPVGDRRRRAAGGERDAMNIRRQPYRLRWPRFAAALHLQSRLSTPRQQRQRPWRRRRRQALASGSS